MPAREHRPAGKPPRPRGVALWCQLLLGTVGGGFVGHALGVHVGERMTPDSGLILMRGFAVASYAIPIALLGAVSGMAVAWLLARWLLSTAERGDARHVGKSPAENP